MINRRLLAIVTVTTLISSSVTLLGSIQYNKAQAQNVTKSKGGCPISALLEAQNAMTLDVLSPVAESSVKQIKQAPRLNILNGKTIAVVGGSFMANITHHEIKRIPMLKLFC